MHVGKGITGPQQAWAVPRLILFGTPTCEVPTVLLLNLLSRLKLLFGMPLRHLVLQVHGVSLLPVGTSREPSEPRASPGPPLPFLCPE